ncbi:DUF3810 domain-containing protein [Chitinophagaceae bacterium MMS25-I14]
MRYRNKLIFLSILVVLAAGMQYALPNNPGLVRIYDGYIFRPYQSFRNILLGKIPFSVGDIFYFCCGIAIIITFVRWGYFIVKIKTHHHYLGHSLVRSLITLSVIYVLFFIGWGGNYYKPSLAIYWQLNDTARSDSILVTYDRFLIQKLNAYATHYQPLNFKETDRRARNYYKAFTDSRTRLHGLNAKPSIFGYMMQYLEIQGYYNPFSGEAQVNAYLPSFMLPFVICHEMAHQSGIAAEGDANLLSYAVCTRVNDTAFGYSAYFNIWLYTHSRLRMADSAMAGTLKKTLNPLSLAQLDTLRAIRKKYQSEVSDYSSSIYDTYLRMHHQAKGIGSYGDVVSSAWKWELKRRRVKDWLIRIP